MFKNISLAPIVLFVFNRPEHLKQTINALAKNIYAGSSELIIYSDAAKQTPDVPKVKMVREYLPTITGFKTINIVQRKQNLGLAKSITNGISEVLNKYDKVIVLEDDLLTSKYFLKYMNEALNIYQDDEQVISIHGYVYPMQETLPETYFLRGADCWGWATWKRGWQLFESDGSKLRQQLLAKRLISKLNWDGNADYFNMLNDQINGKNDSWAIRWLASAIVNNKLTLYPGYSLVRNIGLDGSGTNCFDEGNLDTIISLNKPVRVIKQTIKENQIASQVFKRYFRSGHPNWFTKLKNIFSNIKSKYLLRSDFGWSGDYQTWSQVKELSTGYDQKTILNKVVNSLLKVKNGLATYERDSVLFDHIEYSWPVLSSLLWSAAKNHGHLNVVDFGGSLGSTFYQNRKFFIDLKKVSWSIVEQPEFVKKGKQLFSDGQLAFFDSISECVQKKKPKVLLLSSVLQYMENPYIFLNQLLSLEIEMIIIDRTGFVNNLDRDRLTLQVVDPAIYTASYPCWFFNEINILKAFEKKYNLVESFNALDTSNIDSVYKGYIFLHKKL